MFPAPATHFLVFGNAVSPGHQNEYQGSRGLFETNWGRMFIHLYPSTYYVLFLYWEKKWIFICIINEYLLISVTSDNLIALLKLLLHIFV